MMAYNPLAGGMLAKPEYSADALPDEGRFAGKGSQATRYRQRYWKAAVFDALALLRTVRAPAALLPCHPAALPPCCYACCPQFVRHARLCALSQQLPPG